MNTTTLEKIFITHQKRAGIESLVRKERIPKAFQFRGDLSHSVLIVTPNTLSVKEKLFISYIRKTSKIIKAKNFPKTGVSAGSIRKIRTKKQYFKITMIYIPKIKNALARTWAVEIKIISIFSTSTLSSEIK